MRHRLLLFSALLAACGPSDERLLDEDGDGVFSNRDCDDQDARIFPGADELCDGVDNDCDGAIDEEPSDGFVARIDSDGDGWGGPEGVMVCALADGLAERSGDCDDTDPAVNPDAEEHCDAVDWDCDGDIHTGAVEAQIWFFDADGDGVAGTATEPVCSRPEGVTEESEDCDDDDPDVYPGAPERCDQVDNDCDGDLGWDWFVPTDAPSLQQLLPSTRDGDRVCLSTGSFAVDRLVIEHELTIAGISASDTTLDSQARSLSIEGGTLHLQDLALGRAKAAEDPILRVEAGRLDLDRVQVRELPIHPSGSTALLVASESEVTATDLSIAGITLDGPFLDEPVLTSLLLQTRGGALRLEDLRLTDIDLSTEERSSGLALMAAREGQLEVEGMEVRDLDLGWYPSLFFVARGEAWLSDIDATRVSGRRVTGGILRVQGSTAVLTDIDVSNWDLDATNGAVLAAIEEGVQGVITLDHVTVQDSTFGRGRGAVWFGQGEFDLTARHIAIIGNQAAPMAGWMSFFNEGGTVTVTNMVSAGNTLTGHDGGRGAWFDAEGNGASQSSVRIENATFADAKHGGGSFGRFLGLERVDADLVNVWVGNALDGSDTIAGIESDVSFAYCAWEGQAAEEPESWPLGWTEVETRVIRTPEFTRVTGEPSTWDLHPLPTSPLVDAGDPSLLDADGTRSDIGAYGGPGGADW